MSNSDIKTPPEWACWTAQDANGAVWAFEVEPNEGHRVWYENEVGRYACLGVGEPNSDWRNSVVKLST